MQAGGFHMSTADPNSGHDGGPSAIGKRFSFEWVRSITSVTTNAMAGADAWQKVAFQQSRTISAAARQRHGDVAMALALATWSAS